MKISEGIEKTNSSLKYQKKSSSYIKNKVCYSPEISLFLYQKLKFRNTILYLQQLICKIVLQLTIFIGYYNCISSIGFQNTFFQSEIRLLVTLTPSCSSNFCISPALPKALLPDSTP